MLVIVTVVVSAESETVVFYCRICFILF